MTTKSIKEIIALQNYCRDIIQELYHYESRPYESFVNNNHVVNKIEEAIRLEIIEHDTFDDELSLSADTEEYYRTRLGQNSETNIGYIGEKLKKLDELLKAYNIRKRDKEDVLKEKKAIYKLLNQIPSILKYNLQALSSSSVFTFKNEANFEIKMMNLKTCKEEIQELSMALKKVDRVMAEEWNFFRSMDDRKISFAIHKIKRNSADLERSFAQLHDDIIHFINQSIQDGKFIKHIKELKQLIYENRLKDKTNIEELLSSKQAIGGAVKEKKILPDDKMYAYVEQLQKILKSRKKDIVNMQEATAIEYDIQEEVKVSKVLYNYSKIHKEFLEQEIDLISFLLNYPIKIEEKKLMGVFIRLLKNYASEYIVDNNGIEEFIEVEDRLFLKVHSHKIGKYNVN